MHSLDVLNSGGHLTLTWDPEKDDETKTARDMVEKLRAEGYAFFVVAGNPGDDEVEQGNGMIIVRRIEDPTEPEKLEEALPPEHKGDVVKLPVGKCIGTTLKGTPCKRKTMKGKNHCPNHPPGKVLKGAKTKTSSSKTTKSTGRRHVAVRRMAGG